jgi:hypothetical protein
MPTNPINFPNTPANNETHTENGVSWKYDSTVGAWLTVQPATGGGGGASVSVGNTAPVAPTNGDLWWNTDIGRMFVYYTDSNSSQWVESSPGSNEGGAGKQTMFIPAAAMVPRITNGPSDGIGETATNRVMRRTLDYDAATAEFSQFAIAMPKSWDESTVTFQAIWSHPSTSTNFGVVWSLAGVANSDTDALEAAFGTAVNVTDTGGTTDTLYISAESSAVTIAGTPAELDQITLQIGRVPSDGSDTMAVDARLHGIRLFYATNAATDA